MKTRDLGPCKRVKLGSASFWFGEDNVEKLVAAGVDLARVDAARHAHFYSLRPDHRGRE